MSIDNKDDIYVIPDTVLELIKFAICKNPVDIITNFAKSSATLRNIKFDTSW
jgi:hypothetical protein